MEFTLFLITLLWPLKMSSGIRCYLCDPEYSGLRRIISCDYFNATTAEAYITDCPRSTMCTKRVTTLDIGNGLFTRSVQRGCASQTTEGEQKMVNRGWVNVDTIYEPYEEKCIDDPNNGYRATKTVLCYCRGDLCNSAARTPLTYETVFLTLGVLLLGKS